MGVEVAQIAEHVRRLDDDAGGLGVDRARIVLGARRVIRRQASTSASPAMRDSVSTTSAVVRMEAAGERRPCGAW